ncbi:MAG TPA: hypothetical protein VGC93_02255, partial [Thermoanaerobaculia bacterium]
MGKKTHFATRARILVVAAAVAGGCVGELPSLAILAASPVDAVPCPADYNGDGLMDFALKAANGIWYIDVGNCSFALRLLPPRPRSFTESTPPAPQTAELPAACSGGIDDDLDSAPTSLEPVSLWNPRINDGCPAVGAAETYCDDQLDNDNDGLVNDGCPATGRYCQGPDAFGGRWDFAYPGYGDDSAVPVPADYGRVDGSVDPEHRADLAVKDGDTGMWGIDFADNG